MIVKAPMFWLSLLSIFQGAFFDLNCFSGPALLNLEDKILVWGVLFVGLLLVCILNPSNFPASRPFAYLCNTTSLLRRTTRAGSSFSYTENTAFHGGGLVQLPSLVMPISLGSHFFNKLTLTLFLAFLML